MTTYLMAGVVASLAGLLVFLVIHHFWILPIWFILPPGLLIALLGGLAVGWSYFEIRQGLPARPWTALAIFCLFILVLAPSAVLAQLRPALVDSNTFSIPPGQGAAIVVRFTLELVLTAALVGAACGWVLGRSPAAALSTAIAGIAMALGPGHNIPFWATPRLLRKACSCWRSFYWLQRWCWSKPCTWPTSDKVDNNHRRKLRSCSLDPPIHDVLVLLPLPGFKLPFKVSENQLR